LDETKRTRKLSNFLIDKDLQLRYVLFVTAISALICGTLGFLIWQQADVATNIIRAQLADTPEMAEDVIASLRSGDQNLVLTMAASAVGLVVVLSLLLVVMTHKVAGPLFKVSGYFDKMSKGRLDTVWPLRRGDMLQGFYSKFAAAHRAIKTRHMETNEALKSFVSLAQESHIALTPAQKTQVVAIQRHCESREKALAK